MKLVLIIAVNWGIEKLQIVECNALPTLVLMLRSEDAAIHYEAVCSCSFSF